MGRRRDIQRMKKKLERYLTSIVTDAKKLGREVEKVVAVHKGKDWEIIALDRDDFAIWYGGFEGYGWGSVLTGEEVVECVKGIVDYIEYFVDTLLDDLNDEEVEELYRIWKEYDVLGEVYGEIDIREGRIYIKSWAYSFGPYGRSSSGSVELRVIEEE